MVEITKYARNKLLETLSANLEYSNDYGTPPIFNGNNIELDPNR